MSKQCLLALSYPELETLITGMGSPRFVAKQVWEWIYSKHVVDFDAMHTLKKDTREQLKATCCVLPSEVVERHAAGDKTATKYVLKLQDGQLIEMVVLFEKTHTTLCISSQSGCPVDCKFCLTGVVGFKRQLTAHEITGQLLTAFAEGHPIQNVVFMGMGEPLMNYDNVFAAIDQINSPEYFGIGKRHVTVSTSGYIAGIKRLIADKRFINLAFSVGHANPEKRSKIMPIETRNPIFEVSRLLHQYLKMHNRKLTLEYTLLENTNEDSQAIAELIPLAKYLEAKINVINLNPHSKIPFSPVSEGVIKRIRAQIKDADVPVTIRFRRGQDIAAACGQLGESHLEKS